MACVTDLVPFKNILQLSDFSPSSDNGLRHAIAVARAHRAKLFVLHVVIPDALTYMSAEPPAVALDLQEKWARDQMKKLEGRLRDVNYQTLVLRDDSVWPSVAAKLVELRIDLLVLGTHGRSGLGKLFLGSVAETVLRQSPVPVMSVATDAPSEVEGRFHRVLLATNLRMASIEPARYAAALARRDRGDLLLLHTCKTKSRSKPIPSSELTVAEVLHQLHDLAVNVGNGGAEKRSRSIVEFGDSKTKILEVSKRVGADLIVMGLSEARSLLVATHLEMGTAHAVVANAACPVLTVPEHSIGQRTCEHSTKIN